MRDLLALVITDFIYINIWVIWLLNISQSYNYFLWDTFLLLLYVSILYTKKIG
jgi:hypothetical protein